MNGLPFTLTGAPVLNQAGRNTTSTSNTNNLAGALNAAYLASGDIKSPLSWEQNSATQSANSYLTSNANSDEHPIQSANGQWVSSLTGQAWHGSYNNPNGQTQYFSNGQQVNDIGMVGNQLPNISVQQVQKNPAISGQVASAVAGNANNNQALTKSFNDYLKEANTVASQAPGQLAASESAINPSGTINTLNQNVANTGGQLNTTLANLTAAQNANQANIAAANQGYRDTTTSNLQNLGTTLNTEQNNYETAAQNVANLAYQQAAKQIALYHLGSGTPTSNSGALDNRYMGAYAAINVPLQEKLAAMRMGATNQLYNLSSGLQNNYLSNLQSQYAGQGAVNTQLANAGNANTEYLSQLTGATAQQVQQIQQTVAGLQPQLALQYLQSMGMPLSTAQAFIAGQTQNLAGLTSLDSAANAYNFVAPANLNYPTYTTPRVSIPGSAGLGSSANNYGGGGMSPLLAGAMGDFNSIYPGGLPTSTGTSPTPMPVLPYTNSPSALQNLFNQGVNQYGVPINAYA